MNKVGNNTEEPMVSAVEALSSVSQQAPDGIDSSNRAVNNHSDNKIDFGEAEKMVDSNPRSSINYTSRKATARRGLDPRLPAAKSSSVFDRLYKSHTVASKSHTLSSRAKLKPSTRAKLPKNRNRKISELTIDVETDLLNFNSMTITRSRKVSTPHKIQLESKRGNVSSFPAFSTPQPSQRKKRIASYDQAPRTAPSKYSASGSFSITPRSSKRVYEFSPRMKPLTKLYFVSKFHPGVGLEPVEPISLGYTFFQTFCEYETGGIDSEHIAKEIFIAFFKKDHSQGIRHWKIHEPEVGKSIKNHQSRRGGTVYPLTMNATYAWGNIYRVAHVKGQVRFKGSQNKEIRVENFTYKFTGDP